MDKREVPATIGQRLLWMVDHHRRDLGALNCPLLCRLHGPLDIETLRTALNRLVVRHESMRTTFAGQARNLTQIIHEADDLPVRRIDLTMERDAATAVRQAVISEVGTRIDVTQSTLRTTLWRLAPTDHVLCVDMHHLVTDAWSTGILFQDLITLMNQLLGGDSSLPDGGWQYSQFADYQRGLLEAGALDRHRRYWRDQLSGAQMPALRGPASEPAANEHGARVLKAELDANVIAVLRRLARLHGTSLFTMMLALYYVVLHCLTEQSDLCVGSLFANRSRPDLQRTVGFISNMVMLRTKFGQTSTFDDLLRTAHRTVMGAFAYQELPYQMLRADTIQAGKQRADDVVFHLVGDPGYRRLAGGLEAEMLVPEGLGGRFNLEMALVPRGDKCTAVLSFNETMLDANEAQRIMAGYEWLSAEIAAQGSSARLTDLRKRCQSVDLGDSEQQTIEGEI